MKDFKSYSAEEDLRAANKRLMLSLERVKAKNEHLVSVVRQAVLDATMTLEYEPVEPPKPTKPTKTAETAIAILSDWQLAKKTPSYDTATCEKRINQYAERLIQIADIQRADHPVRELRVYLLGDLVEGELIFPGQAHLIDASLYRQVLSDGPRILGGFLRRMLASFERVRVVGVIGNHGSLGGRARRDYHPESNADSFLYETTRLTLEAEKRLEWASNISEGERNWYAIDQVGDKRFFMFHGDQIKGGFAGFPWYAFGRKILGWRDKFGFDYALSGHFHTPVRGLYGGCVHWGNGSTESDNTYALENLAAQGTPSQWLLFAHPKRGVTSEWEIRLS